MDLIFKNSIMSELISPQKLNGIWAKGFALNVHTVSSIPLGEGHFDNTYSKLGELIHEIKYNEKKNLIPELGKIVSDFIRGRYKEFTNNEYPYPILNGIICVPPSKNDRPFQPVFEIAKKIYNNIHIPILNNLKKVKETPTMKRLSKEESENYLKGAFVIKEKEKLSGKNILLFDDLYGTGTTLTEITKTIQNNTNIKNVFVLTITKTRTSQGMRNVSTTNDDDLPF